MGIPSAFVPGRGIWRGAWNCRNQPEFLCCRGGLQLVVINPADDNLFQNVRLTSINEE